MKPVKLLMRTNFERPRVVKATGRWAIMGCDLVIEVKINLLDKEFISYTRLYELNGE